MNDVVAEREPVKHAPRDHPLLIVNTGKNKGKSTAAFGMLLRSWARGYRCGVYQFVKSGKWKVGEQAAAEKLGGIAWEKMGDGWTWTSRNLEDSAELAKEGWAEVRRKIEEEAFDFLLLDEFTYPLTFGWLDIDEVIPVLRDRPGFQHIVITGRDAPQPLIDIADLVTEMVKVKHPLDAGIKGQAGIEW